MPFLPQKYETLLEEAGFDPNLIAQAQDTRTVGLPYGEGLSLDYSRVNQDGGALTFYANGFTEGRVAKTPTALALAEIGPDGSPGLDVVYTDQQRKGVAYVHEERPEPKTQLHAWMRNRLDSIKQRMGVNDEKRETPKRALRAQALGLLAVMHKEAEGRTQPVNVLAHSLGPLVVQEAMEVAEEQGSNIFEGANIVLLAPAGLYKQETMPRLMARFAKTLVAENFSHKTTKSLKSMMDKAGMKNMFSNIRKSWAEARAVANERLDIRKMFERGIGSLAVMTYAKDTTFNYRQHESITESFDDGRVTWMTPIEVDANQVAEDKRAAEYEISRRQKTGKPYTEEQEQAVRARVMRRPKSSVRGATHNDEQFNPSRVSSAVKQYLNLLEQNR